MDDVPFERLDDLWDYGDPAESERRFTAHLVRARHDESGRVRRGDADPDRARPGPPAEVRGRGPDTRRRRCGSRQRRPARSHPSPARARTRREHRRAPGPGRRLPSSPRGSSRGRQARTPSGSMPRTCSGSSSHPTAPVKWNERAMELACSSSDPDARRWVASLANNMAWSRHDAGDYEEALELFRIALAERERPGRPAPDADRTVERRPVPALARPCRRGICRAAVAGRRARGRR